MILITGASSGIGEATASLFAEKKFPLWLLARRGERLEALAEKLRKNWGVEVKTSVLDLTATSEVEQWGRDNIRYLPEVTVLVNNAGLALGAQSIEKGNIQDWETVIQTNVLGLLRITQVLLPHFLKKQRGHIVNLGSVAGHFVYPNGNVYCASKFAVHALSQSLRQDLLGSGVRVTEISPGMVETEFSLVRFNRDGEKAKAVYQGMTPLTARDVAEAICWAVERPAHVNIQEIVLYPADQASPTQVNRN